MKMLKLNEDIIEDFILMNWKIFVKSYQSQHLSINMKSNVVKQEGLKLHSGKKLQIR